MRPKVHLRLAAAHQPHQHQPAALGQRAEMAVDLGAAGQVEDEVRAAAAGGLAHLAGQIASLQADLLDAERDRR